MGDVTAKENEKSAIFECRLSSVVPDVGWRYSAAPNQVEQVLEKGEKYQIFTEGTRHYLRLNDVKLSDEGVYSCVVDYEGADEIRTSANFVVSGRVFSNKFSRNQTC